jgi:hypothetical protein
MFNGFPVTNTPAVQVWDFVRGASTTATRSVILTDDCAPIQFFKTGVPSEINLYLPPSYPEGKVLTIINSPYLTTAVSIVIYASDARNTSTGVSGTGDNIYRTRPGHTLQFFYTKATLDQATGATFVTGWNCISQGSANSSAPNSFATAGGTTLATNAFAAGGSAVASALQSAVVGGQLNTASGTASIVLGGTSNTAGGSGAAIVGGSNNTTSTTNCFVAGGDTNAAQAISAGVFAGSGNTANGAYSSVIGGNYGTTRAIVGNFVYTACQDPLSSFLSGRSQNSVLTLVRQTTTATATVLTSNPNAAGGTNQVVLPNNSAYYVRGSCIATVTGGGNTKAWSFEAAIKRGANAASTAIVGAVIKNIVAADAGAATWDITIDADTTNGCLRVQVTGQAATTIRWVCSLNSTEVTY